MPVVWIGITLLSFSLMHLVPGDVVLSKLGEEGSLPPEYIEALRRELGLDQPFLVQYGRWLWQVSRGDLGKSLWTDRPVMGEILRRVPASFEIATFGTIVAILLGIPFGVISAVRQDSVADYAVRVFSLAWLSIPNFFLATVLILVPAILFGWMPPLGYVSPFDNPRFNMEQMILPALAIGLGFSAPIMRMSRSTMLEVMRQDYVRTAWAKGLRETVVIYRHALKNALIPVITLIGTRFAAMVEGSLVLIEFVFVIPGVGMMMLESIKNRDYIQIQGVILFVAAVTVIANLIVDITYAWLDPRIKYG